MGSLVVGAVVGVLVGSAVVGAYVSPSNVGREVGAVEGETVGAPETQNFVNILN